MLHNRCLTIGVSFLLFAGILLPAQAQMGGGGIGGGGIGGGGGGGVGGGDQPGADNPFVQPVAGVEIDAAGVLKFRNNDRRLANQRLMAARQHAQAAGQKQSDLRKVSLNRLERALAANVARGADADDQMLSLAGLTRIDHVFFYPETSDIVIAGPAEPVFQDGSGRFRGALSGQPSIALDDVVTALRAFAPGQRPTTVISVSIDPTEEGLKRMQRFLTSVSHQFHPSQAEFVVSGLKENLGLQTVTFQGIPTTTNFARVLLEADYRMKLIGIGLERLPLRFASYVDRQKSTPVNSNAMERWYFEPRYDCVSVSEDGLALRLCDKGMRLVGANERVGADGRRSASGRVNRASQGFCQDFTEMYEAIATRVPVYAELRNVTNAAVAAAYIQLQDFYGQAGWDLGVFADEQAFPIETEVAPRQVETAVNAIWRGNKLTTPLGGGVSIQARKSLANERLVRETDGLSAAAREKAEPANLADDQWWWD